MQNRTPVPRDQRPPLPAFTPVPRKARHDGWTPERQRAFIAALADTGAVGRAAAMVNISPVGAYYLRRQPGADEFRRAWEAALDYGVARMKDIAFERAIEGYLVPMLVGGKLIGWRRKYNDRLLMFCLRHYGQDDNGKRTTVNYFSTRATAAAGSPAAPSVATPARSAAGAARRDAGPDRPTTGEAVSIDGANLLRDDASSSFASATHAEASTTTVRTSIVGKGEPADLAAALGATAATLDDFAGVELDACAQDEILAVLYNCAARQRAVEGTAADEREPFIAAIQPLRQVMAAEPGCSTKTLQWRRDDPVHDIAVHPAELLEQSPLADTETDSDFRTGSAEMHWQMLDDEAGMQEIEAVVAQIEATNAQRQLAASDETAAGCEEAAADVARPEPSEACPERSRRRTEGKAKRPPAKPAA